MCFQAYLLKEILFAEEDTKSNIKKYVLQLQKCTGFTMTFQYYRPANNRKYKRGQKEEKMTDAQME